LTISELGSLGEFLAFIGVAVSLVYLAQQLRQNTASMKVTNSWAMMASFNASHDQLVGNRDTAEFLVRLLSGANLDPADGMRASSVVLRQINILIAAHEAHAMGQLTETLWNRTKADAAFLMLPGPRPFLLLHLKIAPPNLVAEVFGAEVAAEVDQLPEPISPVPPAADRRS
jgi:hypothetical protein